MGAKNPNYGNNLRLLVETISNRVSQFREAKPQVVIVVPPTVDDQTEYCLKDDKYKGAHEKSVQLKSVYSSIAKDTNSFIVDVQDELKTGEDGVGKFSIPVQSQYYYRGVDT